MDSSGFFSLDDSGTFIFLDISFSLSWTRWWRVSNMYIYLSVVILSFQARVEMIELFLGICFIIGVKNLLKNPNISFPAVSAGSDPCPGFSH